MIPTPNCFFLVSGSAEGHTELNTFDNTILNAGVGDTNLIKVSSILPPGAKRLEPFRLPAGALVPIAYAYIFSSDDGARIAAAVAVGIPKDPALPGLIMEHSGADNAEEIEKRVIKMVEFGFRTRQRELLDIVSISTELKVQDKGGAFAAAVLWWK
jgi:arginine decarboxylase